MTEDNHETRPNQDKYTTAKENRPRRGLAKSLREDGLALLKVCIDPDAL